MTSRLGRTIARDFKKFGRGLQRGTDKFGRQLSNTARDISLGIGDTKKVISGIERALKPIPVVGALGNMFGGIANKGLDVLNLGTKTIGKGADASRALVQGDYDKAQGLFQEAVNQGTEGINEAGTLFV